MASQNTFDAEEEVLVGHITNALKRKEAKRNPIQVVQKTISCDVTKKTRCYLVLRSLIGPREKKGVRFVEKWSVLWDFFQAVGAQMDDVLCAVNRFFMEQPCDRKGFERALDHLSRNTYGLENMRDYYDKSPEYCALDMLQQVKQFFKRVTSLDFLSEFFVSLREFLDVQSVLTLTQVGSSFAQHDNVQSMFKQILIGTISKVFVHKKDSKGRQGYGFIKSESMTRKTLFFHITSVGGGLKGLTDDGLERKHAQYGIRSRWVRGTHRFELHAVDVQELPAARFQELRSCFWYPCAAALEHSVDTVGSAVSSLWDDDSSSAEESDSDSSSAEESSSSEVFSSGRSSRF